MAPRMSKAARITKACRALKDLGFPAPMVKAKLQELLLVYGNAWKPIEESNYLLLIDTLLSAQEENQPKKKATAADPEAKQVKRSITRVPSSPPQGTSGRYGKGKGKPSSSGPLKRKRDDETEEASLDSDADILPGELDLEEVSGKSSRLRHKKVATGSSSKKVAGARGKVKIRRGACSRKGKPSSSGPSKRKTNDETEASSDSDGDLWPGELDLKETSGESSRTRQKKVAKGSSSKKVVGGLDADPESPTVSKPTNEGSARDESTELRSYSRRKKVASVSTPEYHEKVIGPCWKTKVKVRPTSGPNYGEVVTRCCLEKQVTIVPNSGSDVDSEDSETPLIRRRAKHQRRENVAETLPAWENETSLVCHVNPLNLPSTDYAIDMYLNDPQDMDTENPYNINNQLQDDIPLAFLHPAGEVPDVPAGEVKFLEYKSSGDTETAREVTDNPVDGMKLLEYTSAGAEVTVEESPINDESLVSEDGLKCVDQWVVSTEDEGDYCIAEEYNIASSSTGGMRLSLVRGPSLSSTIRIPNEVLKVMEDECKRAYKIMDPSFSFEKLMTDFCNLVCVMDSTITMVDTPTSSTSHSSGSSDKAKVLCAPRNDALDLGLLASFRFDNLIEVTQQVPKHINLVGFGFLQSIKSIEFVGSKPNSQLLEGLKCSKSLMSQTTQAKGYAYLDDISKGQENVEIPILNGSCAKDLNGFNYIAENVVLGEANIEVKLGVPWNKDCCCPRCFVDCQTSNPHCECAQLNGGEFAYTQSGLVKDQLLREWSSRKDTTFHGHNLSRPHMERKFIKECWYRCGCFKKCGNRVVQRGITRKLQVFWTPEGKGWGVQTLESLPKGAFVCEYVGAILTISELRRQGTRGLMNEKNAYVVLLDAEHNFSESVWKDDEEALCLDASEFGNVARFINHRCGDANLVGIPVEVETSSQKYYHLAFFTTREVNAKEELTWDYGIEFNDDDSHTLKRQFQCLCSSPFCRDPQKDLIVI